MPPSTLWYTSSEDASRVSSSACLWIPGGRQQAEMGCEGCVGGGSAQDTRGWRATHSSGSLFGLGPPRSKPMARTCTLSSLDGRALRQDVLQWTLGAQALIKLGPTIAGSAIFRRHGVDTRVFGAVTSPRYMLKSHLELARKPDGKVPSAGVLSTAA